MTDLFHAVVMPISSPPAQVGSCEHFLVTSTPLTPEERQEARQHWAALMLAPSLSDLTAARASLRAAAPRIQRAITEAIATHWREGKSPTEGRTPFDE